MLGKTHLLSLMVDPKKKVKDINAQIEEFRIDVQQIKSNQDELFEKLKIIKDAAIKVGEAEAAYRRATESLYNEENDFSSSSELKDELTSQSLLQEELQTKFNTWELENDKKIESLNNDFKDLETTIKKDTNSQIFGLKKRVAKLEESLTSITESLTVTQKWKQQKDFLLWVDLGLGIILILKVFLFS